MYQTKHFLFTFILLFNLFVSAQEAIEDDPEFIKNEIVVRINQATKDLDDLELINAKNNINLALDLAERANDTISTGVIYNLLARLQHATNDSDNALISLNKALGIQRRINDNKNLGTTYMGFGTIYLSQNEFRLALESFQGAKYKFQEQELPHNFTRAVLNEGKALFFLKDYMPAKKSIDQALELANKYNLVNEQSEALIYQGMVYHSLYKFKEGIPIILAGVNLSKKNNFNDITKQGYSFLSDVYYKSKDYKSSREYLNKYMVLSDSLQAIKQSKFFSLKDSNQSDLEKKNLEITTALEKQKEDKNLSTLISILSVSLITILSLLTLSLYKNNNIRLRTNNMLHKKNAELIIAKEKAELASKTKANFLSTVTHELRTPLYAVTGLSNMLLEEDPKPEQIPHLKSLKFSGDYLLTFINDILQINKIEANKVNLEPEPFNLKKKINNIVLALNNSASDNNIQLHFDYETHLPENFIADQLKISQILINLIGNAIKFTKDGDIWIRVFKIKEEGKIFRLRFEIEDNGIGIEADKQKKMFESFSQGSIEINRKYGGTGLGLSIVKGLIDILNGEINVKSEINKGSIFYFELPLEYTQEEEETTCINKTDFIKENLAVNLDKVKILVVEDNKINQMITKKILDKMELKCDIVGSGNEAVNLVKATSYNIVLMDIHMPGISGIEATKLIRAFDKNLIIFALTAVTIEDKMKEFEDAGFSDIIPKPFKYEDFKRKIYKALSQQV